MHRLGIPSIPKILLRNWLNITILHRLFNQIPTIVAQETNQWVTEYKSALKNIENSSKAATEAAKAKVH
jgi:hypothetical protein